MPARARVGQPEVARKLSSASALLSRCGWPVQVWVRDVREAVELLDEATGQRTPKEQVPPNLL